MFCNAVTEFNGNIEGYPGIANLDPEATVQSLETLCFDSPYQLNTTVTNLFTNCIVFTAMEILLK